MFSKHYPLLVESSMDGLILNWIELVHQHFLSLFFFIGFINLLALVKILRPIWTIAILLCLQYLL